MPERSDLDRRLRAVERALTDGEHDVAALEDAAAFANRLDAVEARTDDLEERTAELEAAVQAVRGYAGNIRSVNDEIESRADAALAAVDRIEARLDETGTPTASGAPSRSRASSGEGRHGQTDSTIAASTGSPESDEYGIEMPPPDAESAPAGRADSEDEDEASVIERVREVL